MNFFLVLIPSLLIITYLLDTTADLLDLPRLKGTLPAEFEGVYDPNKYRRSLDYQKTKTRFHIFHRTILLGATLAFLLLGGFATTDRFARSFGFSEIITGLVFAGTLSLLKGILQLPFSVYDTFKIEEDFGFNRTTPKTFITDLIKGTTLGAVLGALVFAGIIYFFTAAGPLGWLYAWLALTIFQVILMYLAPAVIMPLFNKFMPLKEGPLKNEIEQYATSRKFHLKGIFTMDGSKRSTKTNAFFTGFGKLRRLVLFDTLVERHSVDELVAVVAHEIGHYQRKHILKSMALSIMVSGFLFYLFSLLLNDQTLFQAFQLDQISVYASIVFTIFLFSPILRLTSVFTQGLSRKFEYEADRFAADTHGKPDALITALKKLSIDNMSPLAPHPLKVAIDYSHPPILARVAAIRKPSKKKRFPKTLTFLERWCRPCRKGIGCSAHRNRPMKPW